MPVFASGLTLLGNAQSGVWAQPFDDGPLAKVVPIGLVKVFNGIYEQTIKTEAIPAGYSCVIGISSGPFVSAIDGLSVITLGPVGINREDAEAWLVRNSDKRPGNSVLIPLAWPEGAAPDAPVFLGTVGDQTVNLGTAFTVNCAAAFSGPDITYAVADADTGADLPPTFGFNTATGLLTPPSNVAYTRRIIVNATNIAGSASDIFRITVNVPAPTLVGIGDVTTNVGVATQVDLSSFATGTGLVYSTSQSTWTINSETGLLIIPTDVEFGLIAVTATVTDVLNRTATDVFNVTVSGATPAPGPTVIGNFLDIVTTIGTPVTRNAQNRFSPATGLTYSTNRGYAIDQATGIITFPTNAVQATISVTVTATEIGGLARAVSAAPFNFTVQSALPTLAGIGDVTTNVDIATQVDLAGFATGSGLVYSVDQTGWALNTTTGLLTIPTTTAFPLRAVTATVTDQFGRTASDAFNVTVSGTAPPPGPTVIGSFLDILVAVNTPTTRNAKNRFSPSTGLTYSTNRGYAIDQATGIITFPTGAVLASVSVTVTATESSGLLRAVSATPFNFEVVAAVADAPLANTAAPNFAPNTAPGTSVGSVWGATGGTWSGGLAPFVTDYRITTNAGVVVRAFATTAGYTILASDQGRTLVQDVRRTDSSSPPVAVITRCTGSAVIPDAPPPADFDVIVGAAANTPAQNATALINAMIAQASFTGPRRIGMRPGDYGSMIRTGSLVKAGGVNGVNNTNRCTIAPTVRQTKATSAANRVQILNADIDINGWNGFTFDNIWHIDTRRTSGGVPIDAAKVYNLNDPKNMTWRNCLFSGHHRAFATHNTTSNLLWEWNEFIKCGMDSIATFGLNKNIRIQNNFFHDPLINWAAAPQDGRHPDASAIHGPRSSDIVVRSNRYNADEPGYWQGVFVTAQQTTTTSNFETNAIENVTIERNWIEWDNFNAIIVRALKNLVIRDNLIRNKPGGNARLNFIVKVEGSTSGSKALVAGNVFTSIYYDQGATAAMITGSNVLTGLNGVGTAVPAKLSVPDPHGIFGYE